MAPTLDPTFKSGLKAICAELDCRWSFELERWVIYYNNPYNGQTYRVHEVKTPTGEFKNPDQRELDMLRVADMSTKVEDVGYMMSKHYRELQRQKEIRKQKQREDIKKRAKDKASQWKRVAENAERGIYYDWQLGNKTIYSLPTFAMSDDKRNNMQLLKKLGKPHLTGQVHNVQTEAASGPLIINP